MDDICVCCGEYVPEGRMICPVCEEKAKKAGAIMPEYSTADLCWKGVREGRAVPMKGYTLSRNGKLKADLKYEEFVRTVGAGEMLLADWYTAMEAAIYREGKMKLLVEKIEHAKTWEQDFYMLVIKAMEACMDQYYDIDDLDGDYVTLYRADDFFKWREK